MTPTSRPYQHPQDFDRLVAFLSDARADVAHSHYLHTGDLSWQLFHMLAHHAPDDLVHIWEDESGDILGFVLVYPDFDVFDLQPRPDQRGTPLEAVMLEWVENALTGTSQRYTLANDRDTDRVGLLTDNGYVASGDWYYLELPLGNLLPQPQVPPGYVVRSVAGEHEIGARADLLAAAFGAPPLPERYETLLRAPGYDRELDVVAVSPEGQMAAFALCWVDAGSRVGQFEPVGTAPDFRQRGLGKAVLVEGLRRMKAKGVARVTVIVEEAAEGAVKLYKSVGFVRQWNLTMFSRGE